MELKKEIEPELQQLIDSGYTFNGWWTEAGGGTQVTNDTVVSTATNHTLYARWSGNAYSVTSDTLGAVTKNSRHRV